jgi:hypothetical protein
MFAFFMLVIAAIPPSVFNTTLDQSLMHLVISFGGSFSGFYCLHGQALSVSSAALIPILFAIISLALLKISQPFLSKIPEDYLY